MKYRIISQGDPSSPSDFYRFGKLRELSRDYQPILWVLETDLEFTSIEVAKSSLSPVLKLGDGSWTTSVAGLVWVPYRRSG